MRGVKVADDRFRATGKAVPTGTQRRSSSRSDGVRLFNGREASECEGVPLSTPTGRDSLPQVIVLTLMRGFASEETIRVSTIIDSAAQAGSYSYDFGTGATVEVNEDGNAVAVIADTITDLTTGGVTLWSGSSSVVVAHVRAGDLFVTQGAPVRHAVSACTPSSGLDLRNRPLSSSAGRMWARVLSRTASAQKTPENHGAEKRNRSTHRVSRSGASRGGGRVGGLARPTS